MRKEARRRMRKEMRRQTRRKMRRQTHDRVPLACPLRFPGKLLHYQQLVLKQQQSGRISKGPHQCSPKRHRRRHCLCSSSRRIRHSDELR